jgi:uncharacterized protein
MEEIPKFGGKHSSTMLWRFNPEWYRLIGSRCQKCGMIHYPRRMVCVHPCRSQEMVDTELSHTGEIRYAGLNDRGTDGYPDVQPQVFATIKLAGGPHVVGEIVNLPWSFIRESIQNKKRLEKLNGARVEMVIRRFRKHDNGDITYGHKFELNDMSILS